MTSAVALVAASGREAALYRELVTLYRGLIAALEHPVPVDPARLGEARRAADRVVDELRALSLALAPHRLGAAAVPAEVRTLWRRSAELAAEAAGANAEATRIAIERRAAVAARLARVDAGRRAVGHYRPAVPASSLCTDQMV